MSKYLVVNLSNTQRVVVESVYIKNEPRVEIRKEYRRVSESDWVSSKGITIPMKSIPRLASILLKIHSNKGADDSE